MTLSARLGSNPGRYGFYTHCVRMQFLPIRDLAKSWLGEKLGPLLMNKRFKSSLKVRMVPNCLDANVS